MGTKVRAKVIIPVLLFLAVTMPAILIPTIPRSQAEPASHTANDTVPVDPMQWETGSKLSDADWQLGPREVQRYLESSLGE